MRCVGRNHRNVVRILRTVGKCTSCGEVVSFTDGSLLDDDQILAELMDASDEELRRAERIARRRFR